MSDWLLTVPRGRRLSGAGIAARRLTLLLLFIFALAAGLVGSGAAQATDTVTVLDSLGAATPVTQFSLFGAGGISISPTQFPGPKFGLTQQTVLTEIGAFVTTFALPATVEIVPAAADGSPDGTDVVASYVLSSDGDPFTFSYESVAPNLSLPPGNYFALFGVQADDFGILLNNASSPFVYQAGLVPAGFLDPRILGRLPSAAELLASLATNVIAVGPGTSLADKVTQARNFLASNDIPDTCSTLSAFVKETMAQTEKTVNVAQAAALITIAQEIKTKLRC